MRDVPILGRAVSLRVWQRRCTCRACGTPLNEPLTAIDWEQRQTRRSQPYRIEQRRRSAFQEGRRKHHMGYRMVERLSYRHAHHQCDACPRRRPQCMGLDAWATRTGHHYAPVLVNLRTHQGFEVLDTRTKATVGGFVAGRTDRRRLTGVTSDRRREVQEQGPWTLMVVDRFHGMQQATTAFHAVRTRLTRHAPTAEQERLTSMRKLLGQAHEQLVPEHRWRLYTILADFPELRRAHTLVHWWRRW